MKLKPVLTRHGYIDLTLTDHMADMTLQQWADYQEHTYVAAYLTANGTISHAAKAMGISRRYLHTLINKHGIVFKNGSVQS